MTTSPSTTDSVASSAATNAGRASAVAVASLLGLTLLGGTAAAYWTTTGTGTGSAAVAGVKPGVPGTGTATDALYPGATAGLTLTLTNPNDFPIRLTNLDANPTPVVTASPASCTASDVSVNALPLSGSEFDLKPHTPTTVVIPGAISMGKAAASNCQGVALTIAVRLQAESLAPAEDKSAGAAKPESGTGETSGESQHAEGTENLSGPAAAQDDSSAINGAPTATDDSTNAALTDGAITTEETR